ncbi:MAG TPA: glycosyltransferase, partial [Candidatus Thermoplasmatota archaeon]|nr:glycosyltransferase [Candidatus Thermoplasmatota archaeon]
MSVVIPVKNEEHKISKCLEAVINQTLSPYEIIVVDGHSIDDTVKKAQSFSVKILYEDYRTRAGACHVGLKNATGEYIAFTDADCIPRENWLEAELKVIKKHRNVAGVGCCIDNISKGVWEETINEISKTFIGSGRSIQGRQFTKEKKVLSISGCHALYRKKMLEDVGGFNVRLKTCEDTEINKRLRKKGYDLIYSPKTSVLHDHTRGTKLFAKRMFQYGWGRAQSKLFDMQLL